MKRKKILKIIFTVFAITFLGLYIFVSRKKPTTSFPPLKPQIPSYIKGSLPIVFSLSEKDFSFPKTISILTFNIKRISKNEAQRIASKLGFAEEVQTFEDINEGNKFFWKNQKYFLIITEKTGSVEYGLNDSSLINSPNKQISDQGLINLATDFLKDNFLFDDIKIKETRILPLKVSPLNQGFIETTKSQATVHQINFSIGDAKNEILTIDPSTPIMFVRVLPDGNMHSSEVVFLDNLSESDEKYEIKGYQDVLNSVREIKLISLLNDYINISDLTLEDITSISVDKIKLVYLLDSFSSKTLQPVFLLEGDVEVKNSSANRALLYLPAIK